MAIARATLLTIAVGFFPAALWAAFDPSWSLQVPAPRFEFTKERSIFVEMRDGVRLSTDLYLPDVARSDLPAILIRTPYDKNANFVIEMAEFWAGQGYAVAVQDMRGRYESEGNYRAWDAIERDDGYDAVSWIVGQDWSNQRVGTYGCSYLSESQFTLAATRHPSHVAASFHAGSAYNTKGMNNWGFHRFGAEELTASFGWSIQEGSRIFYGPPEHIDRETWFKSEAADLFRTSPADPMVDWDRIVWTLPIVDMMKEAGGPPTDFESWVSHEASDPWWDFQGEITDQDEFSVAGLHVNGWYDLTPNSTLRLFNLMRENGTNDRARNNQFLIMSPMTHCDTPDAKATTIVGERSVGDARVGFHALNLMWFDYWLKGIDNGIINRLPRVLIYVMGKNEWRAEKEWPLGRTIYTKYFLHSDGKANSRNGTGRLSTVAPSDSQPPDIFTYDPDFPVLSVGGGICCTSDPNNVAGALDQAELELREDILVYTTDILEQGVEVTGPVSVSLYVSSNVKDTDFTAKLVDVYPDGRAYNVLEGIIRARYREGMDTKVWMEEGEIYNVSFELESTSNYFAPGHRIRLEVSSSNFPRFDRNLNTGGNNYDERHGVTARNSVHHSRIYPSHLVLPVIPQ